MSQQIQEEQKKYETYLQGRGLRLTKGRQEVFEEVMGAHGHFAAEELVRQCGDNRRRVSRATVYRSLQELREAGIIRETAFGEKHNHFEHCYDEKLHHHARCIRCGTYIELPDLEEEKKYVAQLRNKGFQVLGHELHIYGICRECRGK